MALHFFKKLYGARSFSTGCSLFVRKLYVPTEWTQAVTSAESIIGYNTSFLNLRYLFSDEISNIAVYLKKLIGTGHPLLATAKKLVNPSDKLHQTRGLLVLLVSKAANHSAEILPKQRALAEITELIHTAHLIHNGIIDLQSEDTNLELGNKMAVLCGDYLLAHSCVELAALQNVKVVELISQAISDINTAAFIETTINDEDPIDTWIAQAKLRYGSLLANSCRSSLILGGNTTLFDQAHLFGMHMGLAWQLNQEQYKDLDKSGLDPQDHPSLLAALISAGNSESDALKTIRQVRDENVNAALYALKEFPSNSATTALQKIAESLMH